MAEYKGKVFTNKNLDFITEFETFGDYLELFGGDFDCTETFISTNKNNDIREIIDFVSFVYDIPREHILLKIDK